MDVNCSNDPDQTMSLIDAIEEENYEFADQLITNGCDLNETDLYGDTPLMLLLQKLQKHKIRLELITKLMDAGADVNIKDCGGYTALFCAVIINNKIYTVRMLIDAGADVNIKFNNGNTALIVTADSDSRIYRQIYIVKMLIDAGADINIKNNYGDTALSNAVKKYRGYSLIDEVKMLIEADF